MRKILILLVIMLSVLSCSNEMHNLENDAEKDESSPDTDIVESYSVYDIKVIVNEKNVLSCHLTFKTANSERPVVRYFSEEGKGYELQAESEGTDHTFFLWGMKPERKYTIEIYTDDEELAETAEFVSGKPPETAPGYTLRVKTDRVNDGFVLFTNSSTIAEDIYPLALMVDTDGDIVWYFEYYMAGYAALGDMHYIEETQTVLISIVKGPNMGDIPAEEAIEIDLAGNVVWKSREYANIYYWSDESWHHAYYMLPDDTIATLRRDLSGTVVADKIVNLDRDYNVLWEWRYLDHFEPPFCDPDDWCDWTHCNQVVMKKEKNVTYLNVRNMSKFYKIDMDSGDIIWALGKDGDFTFVGENPDQWFQFAHATKVAGENDERILFYDNGTSERGYSRVVEYVINEETMIVEISYTYHGFGSGDQWFTSAWGDADYLPGGNFFVTAGTEDLEAENRLFEITRDGEMVWELVLESGETWTKTLYNSEKFIPPLKKIEK